MDLRKTCSIFLSERRKCKFRWICNKSKCRLYQSGQFWHPQTFHSVRQTHSQFLGEVPKSAMNESICDVPQSPTMWVFPLVMLLSKPSCLHSKFEADKDTANWHLFLPYPLPSCLLFREVYNSDALLQHTTQKCLIWDKVSPGSGLQNNLVAFDEF